MIKWLVDHATTVLLACAALTLFGAMAYRSLPRESSPDITIPVILVNTYYQGVAPEDVESLVTIPIENELAGLKDVKVMSSTSAEGASIISIEFEPDVVIEDALQKVRDRVNRAKSDLPDDVTEPSIREINFSDIPIMLVTIAGDADEQTLKKLGEDLKDDVGRIPGVLDAKVSGGLEKEIHVMVDPTRLSHYGLAFHDVTGAIRDENSNIPGGEVTVGDGSFLLRTPSEFTDAQQIADVSIKRVGDRPVFVRDVARVVEGYEERANYSRMNGAPSVTLSITKRPGSNIIEISDAVKAKVEDTSKAWPAGVTHRVLADQSIQIRNMVSELQNNIITALILVLGVIILFMGFRPASFVAQAVPLSMLLTFAVLEALGFTLNMIVLFSLILALGMLVDNAIVIVENVYRHLEEGKTAYQAAIDGTEEVAVAVAASTATTVGAFFPLVFWTGIMGEFMGFLPKTVIIVLISSLVVAICFLPVFTSRMLPDMVSKQSLGEEEDTQPRIETIPADSELGLLMRAYKRVLEWSIRWRYVSALGFVAIFLFTFVAYGIGNHGVEFFSETQPDRATIGIRYPDGTDLETTDRLVRDIEARLAQVENIDVFVAEPGVSGSGDPLAGIGAATNEARITLDFLKDRNTAEPGEKVRVEDTRDTIRRLREELGAYPGVEVSIEKEEMGPPVGLPISVEVTGEDYHSVGQAAQALRRELRSIEGVSEVKDNYHVGRPELRLQVDRGAAARIGVSSAQVGNTVRTAVAGSKASALRDGEDEYDIVVQLAPEFREDLQQVLNLRLPGKEMTSPDTFPVPISSVARYELAGGTGSIQHKDQDMVITIEGDVLEGVNEPEVQAAVAAFIAEWKAPPGVYAELKGSNQDQQESMEFLSKAFLGACIIIMLVLVTQFDSIAIPAIIFATVVLSLVGVLWGLIITGTPFGIIMTGIGVISLAGVVVNNAIVLLDYVGQLEERGMSVHDALIKAGLTRFRPVMLTAITTVLGLVPMAIGLSFDFARLRVLIGGNSAAWWGPMAWAVIFGLSFATVLTLVAVPTLFSIYDDFRGLWSRVFKRSPVRAAKDTVLGAAGALAKVALIGLLLAAATMPAWAITLDDAFAAAEKQNTDLALMREATIQTETLRGQAWATMQPQVNASASYVVNQFESELDFAENLPPELQDFVGDSEPVVVQAKEFWSAEATVRQPLFSGTALPLLRGAYGSVAAARLEEEDARGDIYAVVAQSYYGLMQAREAVTLAEQAAETSQGQLELAQRQVTAEMADERALLNARLAVSRAQRDIDAAVQRRIQAEITFQQLTGLPPDVPLDRPDVPVVPPSLEEAMTTALTERPDIRAADKRIEVARLQHVGTNMGWAPRLDGTFRWSWSENQGFNPQKSSWLLNVTASWNLWDGGTRIANAKNAASQVRVSELRAVRTRSTVAREVRTLWEQYTRAESSLATVDREVELSERSLELTKRAFSAGSATWLEVEQAELSLRGSELNRSVEHMNRDLAAVQLLIAVGG